MVDIDALAIRSVFAILRQIQKTGFVVIASYTRENYEELNRDPNELSFNQHMELIKKVGELVAKLGFEDKVAFQNVDASEYWRWIAKRSLPDNRAVRGLFAELKYSGKLDSEIKGIEDLQKLK